MAIRRMQRSTWEKLVTESDKHHDELLGPSPGGAAAELGISRQAVDKAVKAGHLEAIAVYEGLRRTHLSISKRSLRLYKDYRKALEAARSKRFG